MINTRELVLDLGRIYFGMADLKEELDEIFALRYKVYSRKGYINEQLYKDGREIDVYDREGKCKYFFARYEDKIIGSIRLIVSDRLPTEDVFSFEEPVEIKKIKKINRVEFGRFIVIPPDEKNGLYFPRNLIMLFLINILGRYCLDNEFYGGYSFIKKRLRDKMRSLRMPIHEINNYKQCVDKDDVLFNYFNQKDDDVIPIYFLTNEFVKFSEDHIENTHIFTKIDNTSFALNSNIYTNFLKNLKII